MQEFDIRTQIRTSALIKELGEQLLPVLGNDIQLCTFFPCDVMDAEIHTSELEDVLRDAFIIASQRLRGGGIVLLRTANVNATTLDGESEMPSYVSLTWDETRQRKLVVEIYLPL